MSTTYNGSCHCQSVKFKFAVEEPIKNALSCNCSMCKRKGTLLIFVPSSSFQLLSGENNLSDYQFGKKSIHHYFCSTCGVTSFSEGQMPDGTKVKAVNARCLDDLNPEDLKLDFFNGKDI